MFLICDNSLIYFLSIMEPHFYLVSISLSNQKIYLVFSIMLNVLLPKNQLPMS